MGRILANGQTGEEGSEVLRLAGWLRKADKRGGDAELMRSGPRAIALSCVAITYECGTHTRLLEEKRP